MTIPFGENRRMKHISQSPADSTFVQNPDPFYDRIRHLGDLVHWDDYDMVCAGGYDAVNATLRDRRPGREMPADLRTPIPEHLAPFYAIKAHSMLELDPPRHTRLRSLVLRAFISRRIKELAPEIEALCHQLIDRFPAGGADLLPGFVFGEGAAVCKPLSFSWIKGIAPRLPVWTSITQSLIGLGKNRAAAPRVRL